MRTLTHPSPCSAPARRVGGAFGRRRALTLTELLFASALTLLLMIGVLNLFIEMMRLERSNARQLALARDASDLSRELRQIASCRGQVIDENSFLTGASPLTPDTLVPHDEVRAYVRWQRAVGANAVTSELLVRDVDGDPTTIADNSLILIGDVTEAKITRTMPYVSPMELTGTITWANLFQRPLAPAGVTYQNAPLMVRLRFGDRIPIRDRAARRQNAAAIEEDRWTGPSFESVVLNTVYATRDTS